MVNGKRISAVDDDPAVAHAKVLAIKTGPIEQNHREASRIITLDDALTKYIEARRSVLSPSTIRSYKETQRNRIQGLLKKRIVDITEEDIQIGSAKKQKPATPPKR